VEHALQILVVVIATRILGRLAIRAHQPASVGEILAGILLALGFAAYAGDVPLIAAIVASPAIEHVAQIGIFFLMLYAGVELRPREIAANSKVSLRVALGGLVVPLAAGIGFAWLVLPASELKLAQALVVGTALAITAIPVAVKVFLELGLLHKPVGEIVVSAALFDDVFGLLLLAVVTNLITLGQLPNGYSMVHLLVQAAGFFALTGVLAYFGYPLIWRRIEALSIPGLRLVTLLGVGVGFGTLAEHLGMHFVLGPFMAGLFFEPGQVGTDAYERQKSILEPVTLGILGPVFFAWIGMQLDLGAFTAVPWFLAGLVAIAFLGKLLGAGLPALWSGMGRRDAAAIGVGMGGRGAVELVIISIALTAGVFENSQGDPIVGNLFSALVITAVVTTALTPVLLRLILMGTSARS
jgi:Kef-type K+ transport system membrane component KefB